MAKVDLVGGAKDITKPVGPAPYVVPTLVKGEDGVIRTMYINAATGEPVFDTTGYTILSGGSNIPSDLDITTSNTNTDSDDDLDLNSGSKDDRVPRTNDHSQGEYQGIPDSMMNRNRNPTKNYGYISKETGLGKAISKTLGKFGIAGKAINLGWNMLDEDAAKTARTALGVDQPNVRTTIGNLINGNKGQVADNYDINGNKYSVGFEALSPKGKTNLTVQEALTRQNMAKLQAQVSKAVDAAVEGDTATLSDLGISNPDLSGLGISRNAYDTEYGTENFAQTPANAPTPTSRPSIDTPSFGNLTTTQAALAANSPEATRNSTSFSTPGSSVGFTSRFGPNRPNMPSSSIVDAVKGAVGQTFGPGYSVVGISGTENEGGQYGSNRHKTGLAMDFDVRGPDGKKVTDANALNDMAANFAYANGLNAQVGFGQGYMTDENGQPGRMHLDLTGMSEINPGQASAWGAKGLSKNMDQALSETIGAARAGYQPTPFSNAPTPTVRPNPADSLQNSLVSQNSTPSDDLSPTEHQSVAQGLVSQAMNQVRNPDENLGGVGMTPARAAALGFTQRSPQEMNRIAQAIAGELSQTSLQGLARQDPDAQTEVANMVASIENRAESKMFNGLNETLNPTQYNSLMDANMATTRQNYTAYKSAIDTAVDNYYAGALQPSNFNITSYYNPDVANPSWGGLMDDQALAGQHVFGSLQEYGPDKSYSQSTFGDTGSFMNSNSGTFGTTNSPGYGRSNFGISGDGGYGASLGSNSSTSSGSGLNSAGNRASGAGPMSSHNTSTTGSGFGSSGGGGYGNGSGLGGGGGLNSAGNRASGAGPMSGSNTHTTGGGYGSSSGSSSASSESSSQRGNTQSGSVSSGGGHWA